MYRSGKKAECKIESEIAKQMRAPTTDPTDQRGEEKKNKNYTPSQLHLALFGQKII